MRTTFLILYRTALVVSALSLLYLLFMFGHTETAPLGRILATCAVAGFSAVIAGTLQWAGLPADPTKVAKKKPNRAAPDASKK